jgi:tRNA (mo5U34)-methyltransferase
MLDYPALWQALADLGEGSWQSRIESLIRARLSDSGHGDFARWRATLERLRAQPGDEGSRRELLASLSPWRKGPFELGGVAIDSEWRSDLKWDRLKDKIAPLQDRAVLDVGSGNGYYALQMQDAGARTVIGIDPTLLYVIQFLAVEYYLRPKCVFVLPLRLEELPERTRQFDTTFSMGVLYHQRSPIDHLRQLRDTLRPGGQLVLETLYLPGEEPRASTPENRYARMRNVWMLPTVSELCIWLQRSGFANVEVVDESLTTCDEQRSTEWMTFESLQEALDPRDSGLTVEGWPSPRRVVVLANAP